MKIAPVLRAIKKHPEIRSILVHTGQHYDRNMSGIFFDDLAIPRPDVHLGIGPCSPEIQFGKILARFGKVLAKERPDLVIVVGDVHSTLACAIAARYSGIRIAHVEAGLRSFDRRMPEEINRALTDHLSKMLFTPSRYANQNLLREGVPAKRIHLVGDVMADNLLYQKNKVKAPGAGTCPPHPYAVLTLHRPSNVDDIAALKRLFAAVNSIARGITILFPVHPRTIKQIRQCRIHIHRNIRLLEPLGYNDFLRLLLYAKFVLTDSGGIQTETSLLDIPCITLRENTEQLPSLRHGTNILTGTDKKKILGAVRKIMRGQCPKSRPLEFWDGKAAERMIKILLKEKRKTPK